MTEREPSGCGQVLRVVAMVTARQGDHGKE